MKLLYLFMIVMVFASCHKDVSDDNLNSETETQITVPYTFNEIEGTLVGYVYGEDNQPISNAAVSIYSASTSTNEYGVFQLLDVKMDGQGTLVIVTKDGYVVGTDFIYPNDNGAGTARLKLLKSNITGSFNSADGGSVAFRDNGLVTFTANSIAQQNGSSYTGLIEAYIRSNYPLEPLFNDELEGGLIGVDNEGKNTVLGSFGSVYISLQSSTGEDLQIKSQQTFTIKFPVAQNQLSIAKEEVIVWKYDASTGYWNEVGIAQRNGQFFVIEVSEIGNYMFAEPYSITHYCARLINEAELPARNYKFNVFIDNKLCGAGISDNDGFICSKLPMGEDLNLQIIHPLCNEVVKNIAIGPLGQPNNGGDITIGTQQDIRSGNVLCNNDPVSDAIIIIRNEGSTIIQTTDGSGAFNLNLGDIVCTQDQVFEVLALKGNNISPVLEVSAANMLDLKLEICETECDYTVSFSFEKLDYCASGEYDVVTAVIVGGSGQFSYKWNDGGSGVSNASVAIGLESCVNVTDLSTGCVVDHCEIIQEYTRLELIDIYSYNNSCAQNGGVLEVSVLGGESPYDFKWVSDNGFNSTIPNPSNVWPGLYQLTITDVNACEVYGEVEVYDVTTPIEIDILYFCDFSTITIVENDGYGPFVYNWQWNGGQSDESDLDISIPGEYSVSITDQNDCTISATYTINSVGIDVELDPIYNCEENSILFDALNSDYQYFYESVASSERFDIAQDGGQIIVPILESGYEFYYGAEDLSVGCENRVLIELPHFEGLQIQNIENTSCEICNDGFINVFLDNNQDCTGGCVTGEIVIIDKLSGADVTNTNEQIQLAAGNYIVIVTDENTGCYIAHEEVIIE
jgi:hypothetical protein